MPVKDLPGYYPTILDGGLGVLPPSLAGLFCIIGTCEQGSTDVRFAVSPDDVTDEYGFGELTRHSYDAFVSGAPQVGLVRAVSDKPAATPITTPELKIHGKPDSTTASQAAVNTGYVSPHTVPGSTSMFRLKIVKGGKLDEGTYKISSNDGITWSSETKFIVTDQGSPRKSRIDMGNGTYIEFTEAATAENTFIAGDEYRWWTHEPRASRDSIIDACEKALAWKDPNTGQGFEFIYVPIFSDQVWETRDQSNILTDWTNLITQAATLWTEEQRPVFFLTDAPPMLPMKSADSTEELADWITLLNNCSAAKRDKRLSVNAGYASLTDGRGALRIRAAGGCAAGLMSKAKLHHSVGWVRYMRIPNSVAVYPAKPVFSISGETIADSQTDGVLAKHPVVPWSVSITDSTNTYVDGGDGILYDATTPFTASGTIDYDSGVYHLDFSPTSYTASYDYVTTHEMDKGNLALLNDARYLTLRHWIGYGIRFTDDWMMAPATSDYFCLRNRRIVDEAVRMVGIANVPYINSPGISEKDMAAYKADLTRPLEAMKITEEDTDKPIINYRLVLTPDENIWSNGIVNAKIEIIPTPTKKKLEATFQLRTKLEE